jgi:hypothetical protein
MLSCQVGAQHLRDIDEAHLKLKSRVAPVWVKKSSYHRHLKVETGQKGGGHRIETLNLKYDDISLATQDPLSVGCCDFRQG